MTFREASQVKRLEHDLFEAHIPDGWQQGKGAFGGLIMGTIVRAARAFEHDAARSIRTFSADIAGPVMVGRAHVRVRELRRGQSQTNLQLDLEQDGNVLTSALCTLSSERRVEVDPRAPPAPEAALDWQSVESMPPTGRLGPAFAQHYEYRITGPLPFSGAAEPQAVMFVREREAQGDLDEAALVAYLDAPWPSLFAVARRLYAMATVSFSAQFLPSAEPLPADRPLYTPGRMITQHEGYCFETRELWAGSRLVAMSQQTTAVLR
jgi:acyl-CoA thioesterase